MVVNWSLCHETFSFTAREALAAGAFVVTHAAGRPSSRPLPPAGRNAVPRKGELPQSFQASATIFPRNEARYSSYVQKSSLMRLARL